MPRILKISTSLNKGERKTNTPSAVLLKDLGLEGDAHTGFAHRQVSLLAIESIEKMRQKGLNVNPGDFAENLTTEGMNLVALPVGTRLKAGRNIYMRVTQIGKECHNRCAIYHLAGDCVMPREGIFTEVLRGGELQENDALEIIPSYRFAVITASDKGAAGLREDVSGPLIAEMLRPWGDVVESHLMPDEQEQLSAMMRHLADEKGVDLIVTTGGTGLSPRDVTPEATLAVIERAVPGIPEALRAKSLEITSRAMLSRAVAGMRGRTLIVNLPGSPKAVKENLGVLTEVLDHALEILSGRGGECAAH